MGDVRGQVSINSVKVARACSVVAVKWPTKTDPMVDIARFVALLHLPWVSGHGGYGDRCALRMQQREYQCIGRAYHPRSKTRALLPPTSVHQVWLQVLHVVARLTNKRCDDHA